MKVGRIEQLTTGSGPAKGTSETLLRSLAVLSNLPRTEQPKPLTAEDLRAGIRKAVERCIEIALEHNGLASYTAKIIRDEFADLLEGK